MYLVEIRCAQWHRDDASSYIFPCPVYRIQYLSSSESLISREVACLATVYEEEPWNSLDLPREVERGV